jgi:hypothetical protein
MNDLKEIIQALLCILVIVFFLGLMQLITSPEESIKYIAHLGYVFHTSFSGG